MKKYLFTFLISTIFCIGKKKDSICTIEGKVYSSLDTVKMHQPIVRVFISSDRHRVGYAISGKFKMKFDDCEDNNFRIMRFENFAHDYKDTIIDIRKSGKFDVVLNYRKGNYTFTNNKQMLKVFKKYVKLMYVKRNYDEAIKIWDSEMFDYLRKEYRKTYLQIPSEAMLLEENKIFMQTYIYSKARIKRLVNDRIDITSTGTVKVADVAFKYRIKGSKKYGVPRLLQFVSYDNGKTWSFKDVQIAARVDL